MREQGLLETLLEALRCMTDQLLESVLEASREGLGPAEVDVHIFRGQVGAGGPGRQDLYRWTIYKDPANP